MSRINNETGSAVMLGEQMAKNYLTMQKIVSNAYLGAFYNILSSVKKTGRYLEIGSGPGYQTATIMNKYQPEEILVVEPSEDMVAAATAYMGQRGFQDKVIFHPGFVEDESLIQSLGKFDLIYSTLSLHHWADPVHAFCNLYQALKPGGTVVIHDFRRIELPFDLFPHKGTARSGHRAYTADEIGKLLARAGIIKYELVSNFPFQILVIHKANMEDSIHFTETINTLDALIPGQEGKVIAFQTDNERTHELKNVGILPAARLKVINSDTHYVVCGVDQKKVVIDRETASGISVRVL